MEQSLVFDPDLIRRYDRSGPRYTSYPTAVQFHEGFGECEYHAEVARSQASDPGRPLSLYLHIPFCDTVCFYCACNKVATKDRSLAKPYLARLYAEIARQGKLFNRVRQVDQLHWGGGTPTFLSAAQMRELMRVTGENFCLREDDTGEYSIEIDPREADASTIALLRQLGFNRLSLGVQDFDPPVQRAVNRIQSETETFAVMDAARREGFKSVSVDLIYGLPLQSVEGFTRTLDQIIASGADRLSVFNYAHLPERFKPQRRIHAADLPGPAAKLAILQRTIERLTESGYVYIGMDHFAKPGDELAVAQRQGTLYRNFQGYSTHADCELVGMGVSSIGMVGTSYSQNYHKLEDYYARIDAGRLAVFRGVALEGDDLLRRAVITQLICHFVLDFASIEARYGIRCADYFAMEFQDLAPMQADGLVDLSADRIQVLPRGRLLIRNICMVFDRYLRENRDQRFSKVI